jgi:hypothetical protein
MDSSQALIVLKNLQAFPEGVTLDVWALFAPGVEFKGEGMFSSPNGRPEDGGLGVQILADGSSSPFSIQSGGGSASRFVVRLFARVPADAREAAVLVTWPEQRLDISLPLDLEEIRRAASLAKRAAWSS